MQINFENSIDNFIYYFLNMSFEVCSQKTNKKIKVMN